MVFRDWLKELEYEFIQGNLDCSVKEVIYDSRKVEPGSVFVCMKGTKVDSHDFISQVLESGVEVLVTERPVMVPGHITVIRVSNAREALARLSAARFGYPAKEMTMIGVTGTKGKTTSTHMMKAILEAAGKKTGMIGTNGVSIGADHFPTVNTTPESYDLHRYFRRMVEAGCQCCVMEVSSQALKMHRVDGIIFDEAVFTNISPDHIGPDEHEDFQEYLDYKSRLFRQSCHGILNLDDSHIEEIKAKISCPFVGFSLGTKADFCARKISYLNQPDFVGVGFQVEGKASFSVRVSIPGTFNVYNALSAIVVAQRLGIDSSSIGQALSHVRIDGRMEIVYTCKDFCVIVDYAHNAVSMEELLTTLRQYQPKRLVCVFGSGGNRSKDRRYSMGEIAGKMADLSIITADNSRFEKVEDIIADIRSRLEPTGGAFLEIPDRREAIAYSIVHAQQGDMIAIIGKGHEDYQEIEGVRYPFLDRTVVLETIEKQ